MTEKQIHAGHRTRLKDRFLKEGLSSFNDINALELLLFYCIPKQDTNIIAHNLLDRFGSFDKVVDAPVEELMEIKGIGHHCATFLKLISQAHKYYQVSRSKSEKKLNTLAKYGEYLQKRLDSLTKETLFVLCMDAGCKVLCCEKIGEGGINSANVPVRQIVELALKVHASTVVVAHNHPSGIALPSAEDVQTTIQLGRILRDVDVILLDHIIVAGEDYVSLFQSNLYDPRRINDF